MALSGPRLWAFHRKAEAHKKRQGIFSMRHSHHGFDSTWTTTWFSTFFHQRLGVVVTVTDTAFIGRILKADSAAAADGPSLDASSETPFGPNATYCTAPARKKMTHTKRELPLTHKANSEEQPQT